MNRDISKLSDPSLGVKVLQVLNRMQTLPRQGFVAGQAVASAIDEVLGTGTPIYNDIDIFADLGDGLRDAYSLEHKNPYHRENFSDRDKPRSLLNETVNYREPLNLEYDEYSQRMFLATRHLYTIREAYQVGMLNLVDLTWGYDYETKDVHKGRQLDLISAFDLNNVQASVDLTTGKLETTAAFRKFFQERQLRPATLYTPVHTLIRAFKKARELPEAYLNKDEILVLLSSAIRANEGGSYMQKLRKAAMSSGMVFLDQGGVNAGLLKGLNEQHVDRNIDSTHVRVGAGLRGAPLVLGSKFIRLFEENADELRHHLGFVQGKGGNLFLASTCETAPALMLPAWPDSSESRQQLDRYCSLSHPMIAARRATLLVQGTGRNSQEAKLRALAFELMQDLPRASRFSLEDAIFNDVDFFAGLTSEKDLRQLFKDASEHSEIASALSMVGLHTGLQLTRKLRKSFAQYKVGAAWGILAGMRRESVERLLRDEEFLKSRCAAMQASDEPLVQAMPLFPMELEVMDAAGQAHKVVVEELLSHFRLRREGINMRHCVGGYGFQVEAETCRILHLELPGTKPEDGHATAEWQVESRGYTTENAVEVTLGQLRGVQNSPAHPLLHKAEELARARFNQWLDKNREEALMLMVPKARAHHLKKMEETPQEVLQKIQEKTLTFEVMDQYDHEAWFDLPF